ncbi:hypothetical protein DSO57_1003493 [Entomophthora muscae]|uniref:Uncharacterized protein n=1 Tax=Entomophthora muscae TaxID=34485 RepID=A0ACC2RNC7_9FUNG|nr:hypothetical protein DSO57_1003493 [Entomophthora muscae]
MSLSGRIHTPCYASQPTGRRSLTNQNRVMESVLPDKLVAQIHTTHFDEILDGGFTALKFICWTQEICRPIKLTLTPSNDSTCSRRDSTIWF